MGILFRKLGFGVLAAVLALAAVESRADDGGADAVLNEVAGKLLDGSRAEALARLEEALGKFTGTPAAERLREVGDMIKLLDEVDRFALEDLGKRVGEKVPATIRGQRQPVEIVRVDGAAAIRVARREGPAVFQENISLDAISPPDKLNLLRGMPEGGRALHTALLAWEARRAEPFSRFAPMTGPLASPLQEIARQRVENEKREAASRREAERLESERQARERAMTRVAGTEEKVWEEFAEDTVTRISCDLRGAPPKAIFFEGRESNPANETQTKGFHYDLYIPEGYNQNSNRWYPAMFIASPGGNAQMGPMAERLRNDGYVVVMLVESRNATSQWLNNFLAAHDDVVARVRVAPGAKFGTGMSGGARTSSSWPGFRSGFSGIILQAAGVVWGIGGDTTAGRSYMSGYTPAVAMAMTMGNTDVNFYELYRLRKSLNSNCPARIDIFHGGHTWCPAEVFDRVMNWQEKVNFLAPPRSARTFNAPYAKVEYEPIHPVAYKWFFLLTHRRARSASNPYHQYFHLSRLPVIASSGGIGKDPEVSDILKETSTLLNELRKRPEVFANLPVEKAYAEFVAIYDNFVGGVAKALDEGKTWELNYKHSYSRGELESGRQAFAAGQAIVEKYPDTPQADFLRGFLPGIEIELSLGQ